ncbi:hypothetical protein D3C78_1067470 [compost metagenome]
MARILAEEDHVGNRVGAGRAENLVRQPIGAQELGLQAGSLTQFHVTAVAAAGATRRNHERRQAAGLELVQRAQDEIGLQRLALVLRVVILVAATVSQGAKRHVADHGVVDLVWRRRRHALEGADGGGVARAVVHQGVDAAGRGVQFHGVHGGALGRGGAEDAHARARIKHLAASKAKLAKGTPDALGDGLRRVVFVGGALLAVGADQRATIAGVPGQNRAILVRQVFPAQLAGAHLVQQVDSRVVGLLPLRLGPLLVELVEMRGLAARRRQDVGRLVAHAQGGARHLRHQRPQLGANLVRSLDQREPPHDHDSPLSQAQQLLAHPPQLGD